MTLGLRHGGKGLWEKALLQHRKRIDKIVPTSVLVSCQVKIVCECILFFPQHFFYYLATFPSFVAQTFQMLCFFKTFRSNPPPPPKKG